MTNQNLKQKLMTLTSKAKKLSDLDYLQKKIETSKTINRRTKDGRQLTNELLEIINIKAKELMNSEPPF